jgi:peptidoglycan/xylan/chitin deacetylase (PgdA/CDA1 family)
VNSPLKRGVFILSLDEELAWGSVHGGSLPQRTALFQQARPCIIRLLKLLEKYQIHATWALVGHLFLEQCQPVNGIKHPEIIRPKYSWYPHDWFLADPCSRLEEAPLWYGRDIIQQIQSCQVAQEIGCHTFSHVRVGEPGCSRECFVSELQACRVEAEKFGLNLRSFVFPRNSVGHLDALVEAGFITYRGNAPSSFVRLPGIAAGICRQLGYLLPFAAPVVLPKRENGLWNLPASYFFPPTHRWWRLLSDMSRVYKIKQGLQKAAKKRFIFHLWFHPFNLASQPDKLFNELEVIFAEVCRYRDAGRLDNLTMGELAHNLPLPQEQST